MRQSIDFDRNIVCKIIIQKIEADRYIGIKERFFLSESHTKNYFSKVTFFKIHLHILLKIL